MSCYLVQPYGDFMPSVIGHGVLSVRTTHHDGAGMRHARVHDRVTDTHQENFRPDQMRGRSAGNGRYP